MFDSKFSNKYISTKSRPFQHQVIEMHKNNHFTKFNKNTQFLCWNSKHDHGISVKNTWLLCIQLRSPSVKKIGLKVEAYLAMDFWRLQLCVSRQMHRSRKVLKNQSSLNDKYPELWLNKHLHKLKPLCTQTQNMYASMYNDLHCKFLQGFKGYL